MSRYKRRNGINGIERLRVAFITSPDEWSVKAPTSRFPWEQSEENQVTRQRTQEKFRALRSLGGVWEAEVAPLRAL